MADGNASGDGFAPDAPGEAAAVDPQAPYTSGSRLRAKWRVSADGARDFIAWHDSQLNVDCFWYPTSDGVTRCLPMGAPFTSAYADAACTQAAIVLNASDPCAAQLPAYAITYAPPSGCSGNWGRVHARGAKVAQTTYYFQGSSCTAQTVSAGDALYATTDVANVTFVGAKVDQVVSAATRLRGEFIVADDGTREMSHWFDSQFSWSCRQGNAVDGQIRCIPDLRLGESTVEWADTMCTMHVAPLQGTFCDDAGVGPFIGRVEPLDDSGCGSHTGSRAFATGAAIPDGSTIYNGIPPTSCNPTTAPYTYYREGAEAPPSQFVATPLTPTGAGRLQLSAYTPAAADGRAFPRRATWRDTQLGTDCRFTTAADGVERCVPVGIGIFFSDSACTQPVAALNDPCDPSPKYAIHVEPTGCPGKSHVYPVLTATSAAQLYTDSGGTCTAVSPTAYPLVAVGAEVAASMLATSTITTD
jgi:hypothetical protein